MHHQVAAGAVAAREAEAGERFGGAAGDYLGDRDAELAAWDEGERSEGCVDRGP